MQSRSIVGSRFEFEPPVYEAVRSALGSGVGRPRIGPGSVELVVSDSVVPDLEQIRDIGAPPSYVAGQMVGVRRRKPRDRRHRGRLGRGRCRGHSWSPWTRPRLGVPEATSIRSPSPTQMCENGEDAPVVIRGG